MRYADDLAYVHHHGFADLARGAAAYVVELLARRGVSHGRVIDLGCGSGIVLRALADAGHEAVGVDLSPAMLAIARRTAPAARLLRASLYHAPLGRCHAVLAIGEPLSYLEPGGRAPALLPLFRKIAQALVPGGLFVFDVIVRGPGRPLTRRGFAAGPDWAVLVDTRENAARTELVRDVTSFVKRGRGYLRTREVHRARVLDTARVRAELVRAGFRVRVARSYGTHPLPVRRRAFVCRVPIKGFASASGRGPSPAR